MVHNSPSYASTPNVFGSSHRLQRASTPHNVPRPAKRSWVRFPCPPIDFPEKIQHGTFFGVPRLEKPVTRSTSSPSSVAATRARGARGAPSALGLLHLHILSSPQHGRPHISHQEWISLSCGGEVTAGSGEVRPDDAKGGVDPALGRLF